MDAHTEARMKAEHTAKYRALLARVGPQGIRELVEPSRLELEPRSTAGTNT